MSILRYLQKCFFFCLFLTLFITSNKVIKDQRNHLSANYALDVINVPAKAIRFLSVGFSGVMADYILMQVVSFTGSGKNISENEWDKVLLGFDQVMELDPYFEQTYLQAQSVMAWDAKKPSEAIRLLNVSRNARFWDFRPGFYMGFDYYFFLGDYISAAQVFLETSTVENCPALIPLLASRFAVKSGWTEASILVLSNMLNQPDMNEPDKLEIEKRLTALKGVAILENAVRRYSEKFKKFPNSLIELVDSGILEALPTNPYSKSYMYDSFKNEIRFDDVVATQQ